MLFVIAAGVHREGGITVGILWVGVMDSESVEKTKEVARKEGGND